MEAVSGHPSITADAQALLVAVGVPASHEGARPALSVIRTCLKAAAENWPDAPLKEWLRIADDLASSLNNIAAIDQKWAVRLSNHPLEISQLLKSFLDWGPSATEGVEFGFTAIIGRSIAVGAEQRSALQAQLVAGLLTLRRAHQQKGRRGRDWEMLLTVDLASTRELEAIRESMAPTSPAFGLVTHLLEAARASCVGPQTYHQVMESGTGETETTLLKLSPEFADMPESLDPCEPSSDTEEDEKASQPDISRRIAAADFCSFGEKLGLYHRDQLLPEDLRSVTQRLVEHLSSDDVVQQSFALLALVSLVTGCTDSVALELEFESRHSIWLDLDHHSWGWDFSAYRGSRSGEGSNLESIHCPLPEVVSKKLRSMRTAVASAETLGALLAAHQCVADIDLEAFRRFLRGCGDTAHPAHRARFARSLMPVVLQLTGSDMTAALMTGRFEAAAPAALFYYGPERELLKTRMNQVFEWLGLGPAAVQGLASARQGCTKVLSDEECIAGWSSLVAAIDMARAAALAAEDAGWAYLNQWMSLVCFAFVVQAGHRATRLERLTFGSLFSSSRVLSIFDKDDTVGQRAQPRLVPVTKAIQDLLAAAIECHAVAQRAGARGSTGAAESVFVYWSDDGMATPVRSAHIALHALQFFASDANFGRSQWVTSLDRDGVDRWLIRALTGHARDVSRTVGAYLDVPPLVAANRLREAMENTGHKVFGPATVQHSGHTWTPCGFAPASFDVRPAQPGEKVPDPRTVLQPVDDVCLMGWAMAEKMRSALAQGAVQAPPAAIALLHLIFVDLIVDTELAIETVILSKTQNVHLVGSRWGLMWRRPHFVEPTWLPIQVSTWRLLQMAAGDCTTRQNLIRDTTVAVAQALPFVQWPRSVDGRFTFILDAAKSFVRLELPPSLVAASSASVPAPALSLHSLRRLSGEEVDELSPNTHPPRWYRQSRPNSRDEGLEAISKALNRYSNQTLRLGELLSRAIECRGDISGAEVRWTPFSGWLRDWVCEELVRTRDDVPGRYQISSIATYFSTLSLARRRVHFLGAPEDWTEGDWSSFLEWTHQLASPSLNQEAHGLCERVRHAAFALIHSLRRRQIHVPMSVWAQLREHADPHPSGSTSSVLVLHADLSRALQIARSWLAESPVEALLVEIRALLSQELPLRAGDLSSLAWDCLTLGGGVVISRQGYNQHKTENAIRVAPVSATCAAQLRSLRAELVSYTGANDLLLRLDGSDDAGLRDSQLMEIWSAALKVATGDPKARPHSVRAAALQERAWPGWEKAAAEWLSTGTSDPQRLERWIKSLQSEWTRTASAAVVAGHGDLRSALGNYLAGWPVIRAMAAESLLQRQPLGPGLVRQVGLNAGALRKARSRGALSGAAAHQPFDGWSWLRQGLLRRMVSPQQQPKHLTQTASPLSLPLQRSNPQRVSRIDSIQYLVLRTLGLTKHRTVESTGIPISVALELEGAVPDDDTKAELTRRARSSARERGVEANIKVARSEDGIQIVDWLVGMDRSSLEFFRLCALREHAGSASFNKYRMWQPVVESMPPRFSILLRRGKAHLTPEEFRFLRSFDGQLKLKVDESIGECPVVSLAPRAKENQVVSARLTAVLRAALFITTNMYTKDKYAN
ncbi:hypothetical protein CLU85_0587 [Acidovorax sp. 69]|uniref:hypothetical protein n=1 Tax=Acidovorax sp. 69 TaxID=2035202 RepID=UPI000CC63E0B|nr:hypothetical protein [Acidovorax sp. 69]PJI95858.1 hypothetical protein CLU85_0587 [Acidovorax sp. 69]